MKKNIIMVSLLAFVLATHAQERRQPPTMEDKLKHTNEFFQKEVGIPTAKQQQVAEVFKTFFTEEDKVRKENPPPKPPPPPSAKVKASMDKLIAERDARLKKILSA